MILHLVRVVKSKTESKSSLDAYADYVRRAASSNGLDIRELEVETTLDDGYLGYLKHGLLEPFLRTLMMRKGEIAHYTFEGLALFMMFCRARKIVTFHHFVYKEEGNPWRWYLMWKVSSRLAVRFSDLVLTVSQQTKEEIVRELGADPDKIRVLPPSPNTALSLDGTIPKRRMVGSVGSLCERKNMSAALRAFSTLRSFEGFGDYTMVICGDGVLKDRLVEESEALGISGSVEFVSDLSVEELKVLYNSCSLVFNTSLHEGLGFLTLEAQQCGTPVMYLAHAQIPPNVMVEAIPCTDESDMAAKARWLLSDPEKYDDVVRRGMDFANGFNEDCVRRNAELYGEFL